MATVEEMWDWIYPAIQELKQGTDQSWESRRSTFLEQLGVADADDDPAVAELVRRLNDLPDAERSSVLDSDKVDAMALDAIRAHATEPAAAEDGAAYDEAAWQNYLSTNGPAWDGSAESWDGFRQWFEYYAGDQGLSDPAAALLDSLTAMSVADRVATFAQYGVTIVSPAAAAAPAPVPAAGGFGWVTAEQAVVLQGRWGPDWRGPLSEDLAGRWGAEWAANPDEYKTAWLADLIAAGAFAGHVDEGDKQEALLAEFAQAVQNVPGIEALSSEEIARIINETINQAGR